MKSKTNLSKQISLVLCLTIICNLFGVQNFAFASEVRINEIEKHQDTPANFMGGEAKFIVKGENLEQAELEAVIRDMRTPDYEVKQAVAIEKTRTSQILTVNFEPNNSDRTKKYEVNFRVVGDTIPNVVPNLPSISVLRSEGSGNTQPTPPEQSNPGVEEIKLTNVEVTQLEEKNKFTIVLTGTNLQVNKIFLKALVKNAEGLFESTEDLGYHPVVNDEKTQATIHLTLAENTGNEDKEYKLKFSVEGEYAFTQTKDFDKIVTIPKKAEGGATEEPPANTQPSITNIEHIKVDNLNHTLKITGTNLTSETLAYRVRMGMSSGANELASKELTFAEDKNSATLKLTFKEQDFKVTFKVQFKVGDNPYDSTNENLQKTIIVEKKSNNPNPQDPANPPANEPSITKVAFAGESNGEHNFTIRGENLQSDKIKVKVLKGEERQSQIESTLTTGLSSAKISYQSLKFPKNETSEDIIYKVLFNADGSDNFEEANSVSVTLKAKENTVPEQPQPPTPTAKIDSIKANNPVIGKEGGVARVTVKGENLPNNLVVKVFKVENNQEVLQTLNTEVYGTNKIKTIQITMPASDTPVSYKVKVGIDEANLTHEESIEVGGNESLPKIELHPQTVSIDDTGKIITLLFEQEIKLVSTIEKLKAGISISVSDTDENTSTDPGSSASHVANNGTFKNLEAEDTVSITDNSVVITLNKAIKATSSSKVKFQDRLIKTTIDGKNGQKEEREGDTFTALIKTFQPIILDAEFIEGEILNSQGGRVSLKITGDYLDIKKANSDTRLVQVVVEKAENQNKPQSERTIINPTVEYKNANEIVVSFDVPQNNSKHSESYMIRVSNDAGFKFTSEIGSNNFERRFRRLITTVMAENMPEDKPVISFISIQSYGTLGGNTELPDITHTNLPTNQESKKTRLQVYGANLDEKLTKIKIVDENNVAWYPIIGEGASDSADNFITVAFNGTGVSGNGTSQKVEIICPRNVAGDRTYKYLLAVDGENFNEEIFVTATVIDDKIGAKNILIDNAKEIVVEHKSTTGEDLAPAKTVKGYSWSKFKSFGIKDETFENYKIKGYKLTKDQTSELIDINDLFEAMVRDSKKITFIYEKIDANQGGGTNNGASGNNSGGNNNSGNSSGGGSNNAGSGNSSSNGGSSQNNTNSSNSSVGINTSTPKKDDANAISTASSNTKLQTIFFINKTRYIQNGDPKNLVTAPYIKNGRIMLPARTVAESLGLEVSWDNNQKIVTFKNADRTVVVKVGQNTITVNNEKVELSAPAEIKNSSVMIELKSIATAFKINAISYNHKEKSVTIN